ncbi:hypothetical protein HII31_01770 [Pseudocercospora fuligena]|uniref:Uncharacterized protein n=1 Tax=Pseudocercospora fuligena TaxID=685502 RepID=A0A8H6RU04_9PEZI|nr:hypothetical protein HII31_01770 [Pseudocercospora fuligena]
MTILHLRLCPQRHPDMQSNPGRVNLDEYDFTSESPEMWQAFLLNVATQVRASDLGEPTIHEPGQCGDLLHTRDTLQQLKSEYLGAVDTEDIYLVHFEQAPQAVASGDATTKADVEVNQKVDEDRSESDSDEIILPNLKKAANKSSRIKRDARSQARAEDEDECNQDEETDEPLENVEESSRAGDNEEDEEIDESSGNGGQSLGGGAAIEEEETSDDEGKPDLTQSDDGNPLIRLGIWLNHDDAQPTLDGNITMDIVLVAKIMSENEIKYYSVPSWFVNGISIGHFELGKIVQDKDIALMASWCTRDDAFAGQNTPKKIRQRLLQFLHNANTKEVSLDDYNHMEDEEVDDNLLIQPPRAPETMDGPFPAASTAKGKATKVIKGERQQNDEDVDIVVYFVDNVSEDGLPLDLNRQLHLKPEESFANFDKWLLNGQGDYEGIRKGLYNEADRGGWDHNIEYEVFVLPQRPKKEGRMWNWKKQPTRTLASFLNGSMEEEYGRKLYIEVHLNVHRDAVKMNEEREKRWKRDPKFRRRVNKFSEQSRGVSGRKGLATKTGSKKTETKKSQEDLPAKKGVARKKTSASGEGRGTKTKANGKKAGVDEDESEHSDEL